MGFFSACWIPIKLLLRVSADLSWDGDLFLCIASCPLNICDQWDLQAGRLSVCVYAWPCVNLIRLEVFPSHRDAPGRSNRHDSRCILNAGIIIYSSLICICIHVHKHIHTSTGGYCAISQNIISALDIWMCERSLSPSMGVYPHPQRGVYRSSGRD